MTEPRVFGILPAAGMGRRVAGLGWRKELYPVGWEDATVAGVTVRRPRVAASYNLDGMVAAGADRIFVVVGEAPQAMHHFGPARGGVPIAYLYQDELRGGAFAIALARPWLPAEHTMLFGFPDVIVEPADAFTRLLEKHRREDADLTLGLFPTDRPSLFGMVRLDGNRPVAIDDKPAETDLTLMYGLACWGQRVTAVLAGLLAAATTARELVPGDIFNTAIKAGLNVRALTFEDGRYLDVGSPEALNEALSRYGNPLSPLRASGSGAFKMDVAASPDNVPQTGQSGT